MSFLARGLPLLLLSLLAACGDGLAADRRTPSVPVPAVPPVSEVQAAPSAPAVSAVPTPQVETPQAQPLAPMTFPARKRRDAPSGPAVLVVSVQDQWLELQRGGVLERGWPVSTSKYGVGSQSGSNKTPLGRHRISEVFGAGAPLGTIFISRINTGRIADVTALDTDSDRVTTRVLWLEGLDPGRNQGAGVDSKQRHIYIHGTPEEGLIGRPASHGCIRMKNADVAELFELVGVGTSVTIAE